MRGLFKKADIKLPGFTLVELIVVALAMSILFLIAGYILFKVDSWWRQHEDNTDLWQDRLLQNKLKEELSTRRVFSVDSGAIALIGLEDTTWYTSRDSGVFVQKGQNDAGIWFKHTSMKIERTPQVIRVSIVDHKNQEAQFIRPLFFNEPERE